MKNHILKLTVVALLGLLIAAPGPASADMSKLVSMLMDNLNVTEPQATGGAGAVFSSAKSKMAPADFTKLADALPGIDDLIGAAPKMDSAAGGATSSAVSSALGSVAGDTGSATKSLGALAGLPDTFSQLGLDADMVGKFADTILQYTNTEAGAEVMNLLKSALL